MSSLKSYPVFPVLPQTVRGGIYKIQVPGSGNRYIKSVLVSSKGMNVISMRATIDGFNRELLLTGPELIACNEKAFPDEAEEKEAILKTLDYLEVGKLGIHNFYIGDALLAPWAGRVWGEPTGREHLTIEYNSDIQEIPINFPQEGTVAIHGLVYGADFSPIKIFERSENSGKKSFGIFSSNYFNWFGNPIMLSQVISLTSDGIFSRKVLIKNEGKKEVILGVGSHPYFLFPEGAEREKTTIQIPAQWVVLPKKDPYGYPEKIVEVENSPFRTLFQSYPSYNRLRDFSLDHCFTGLKKDEDGFIRARIFFPEQYYGIEISTPSRNKSVNAFVVYSPQNSEDHPSVKFFGIKRPFICIEPQTNLVGAFEMATYEKIYDFTLFGFDTPSAMRLIGPKDSIEWEVFYRVF